MAAAPKLSGDVLDVATLFAGHHQEHADAFGAVAGDDARPEANAKLVEAVTPTLEAVGAAEPSDELTGQILGFARDLENQAAYTYAAALTAAAATPPTPRPRRRSSRSRPSTPPCSPSPSEGGPDDLFPTGAFESAALGDGTDPTKGLDPAIFG